MADLGLLLVALGVLGLIVGSFLTVVIARVPEGRSIVRPRSACPACGSPIRPRDNVPVVSWLVLRGRCRACHAPIPVRYPLVEAGNALSWVVLAWWASGDAERLALLPVLLVLASAGLALVVIDVEHHRLPYVIVGPLACVVAVGLVLASWAVGRGHAWSALLGAAIWLAVVGGLWLLTRGAGMGRGDVAVAPVLGAATGWLGAGSALLGLLAAFAIGAVVGVVLLATRRHAARSRIAFGPFLFSGALFGVLIGEPATRWYLNLVGL